MQIDNKNGYRRKQHEDDEELVMKSLCVSAYLRALYHSFIKCMNFYQPEDENPQKIEDLQKKALENMKDLWVLKHLVRLCASVGWFRANIGQKCLYVLKNALVINQKEVYFDQDTHDKD